MPTTKLKTVHTIECFQKIGDVLYPRMFVYMTKKERQKHLDAILEDASYLCPYLHTTTMHAPVKTRAERRAQARADEELVREIFAARQRRMRLASVVRQMQEYQSNRMRRLSDGDPLIAIPSWRLT